jgi:hypothetical protein
MMGVLVSGLPARPVTTLEKPVPKIHQAIDPYVWALIAKFRKMSRVRIDKECLPLTS